MTIRRTVGCLVSATALVLFAVACSETPKDDIGGGGSDGGDDVSTTDGGSTGGTIDAGTTTGADAGEGDGGFGLACTLEEVGPIIECAMDNCLDSISDQGQLLVCMGINCGTLLLGISPECAQCVAAVMAQDTEAIQDNCVEGQFGGGGGGGWGGGGGADGGPWGGF